MIPGRIAYIGSRYVLTEVLSVFYVYNPAGNPIKELGTNRDAAIRFVKSLEAERKLSIKPYIDVKWSRT